MSDLLSMQRFMLGLLLACGAAPQTTPDTPAAASESEQADVASGDAAIGSGNAGGDAAAEPGAAPTSRERSNEAGSGAPTNAAGVPSQCTPVEGLCVPPRAFVKQLCQDAYSGLALRLLQASTPFTRGYVRARKVKAVNTRGGPSSDQSLLFEEEVLILAHTGGPGANEMVVSGMGGYEVLRWDGTCATLSDGELGLRAPRAPGHAPVAWKYIDTNIQDALLQHADVAAARRQHRKHCHGVSLGPLSAECAKAEGELGQSIARAVRGGISLPTPDRMP
jgi:hypothetical protein